jgi:hypothetical protein
MGGSEPTRQRSPVGFSFLFLIKLGSKMLAFVGQAIRRRKREGMRSVGFDQKTHATIYYYYIFIYLLTLNY